MKTPTLRTIDERTIQQVKDRIVAACDPEAIILFGSAARDEIHPASDLDLLVVVDPPGGRSARDQASELYGLFRGWFLPLDLVVRTPEHYEREKQLLGMISNVAAEEGVCIYGKA